MLREQRRPLVTTWFAYVREHGADVDLEALAGLVDAAYADDKPSRRKTTVSRR